MLPAPRIIEPLLDYETLSKVAIVPICPLPFVHLFRHILYNSLSHSLSLSRVYHSLFLFLKLIVISCNVS